MKCVNSWKKSDAGKRMSLCLSALRGQNGILPSFFETSCPKAKIKFPHFEAVWKGEEGWLLMNKSSSDAKKRTHVL